MNPILQRLAGTAERLVHGLTLRQPALGLRFAALLGTLAAQRASSSRVPSATDVIELFGPLEPRRVQQIRSEIARLQFRNDALRPLCARRGLEPLLALVEKIHAEPLLRLRAEGVPIVVTSWHQGPLRAVSLGLHKLGVPTLFAARRPPEESERESDVVRWAHLRSRAEEARFLTRAHGVLEEGTVVGLPLDWLRDVGEAVDFLGRRIRVARELAVLARVAGARVVPVTRRFLGSTGGIEVTFHEPVADADLDRTSGPAFESALLARTVQCFETQIRDHLGSLRPDRMEWLLAAPPVDAGAGAVEAARRAAQRRARQADERRTRLREQWEEKWANQEFDRLWLGRGISVEIQEAVASAWFAPGSSVLDAGCGAGEVAAWFAEQGFSAVGVDVAEAAVARAHATYGERPGRLRFARADLCAGEPEGGPFQVIVDRGCFHQIPADDRRAYAAHLAAVCTPGARLLLFWRAFRDGEPMGDADEIERRREDLMDAFAPHFELVRVTLTYLDRHRGALPEERLPGIVFWLERRG